MMVGSDLSSLVDAGDVFVNVDGKTPEEIYNKVCGMVKLPSLLTAETLSAELCEREKVLSTAVGNGISIPHPRRPMLDNVDDSRIIVCFPSVPLDMNSPDGRLVYVMFILLSGSTAFHIQALSSLAKLFRKEDFLKKLQLKPSKKELVAYIKEATKSSEII